MKTGEALPHLTSLVVPPVRPPREAGAYHLRDTESLLSSPNKTSTIRDMSRPIHANIPLFHTQMVALFKNEVDLSRASL